MMMEARLAAAEEEREMLKKDVEESSLSKESLIKSAWSSRDAAVERKNVAEVELARTRIESMQVIRIPHRPATMGGVALHAQNSNRYIYPAPTFHMQLFR